MAGFVSGCSVLDKDYGKSEPQKTENENAVNIKIPEIISHDTVMPTFFNYLCLFPKQT